MVSRKRYAGNRKIGRGWRRVDEERAVRGRKPLGGLKSRAKILPREKLFSDIGFAFDPAVHVLRQCISNEARRRRRRTRKSDEMK